MRYPGLVCAVFLLALACTSFAEPEPDPYYVMPAPPPPPPPPPSKPACKNPLASQPKAKLVAGGGSRSSRRCKPPVGPAKPSIPKPALPPRPRLPVRQREFPTQCTKINKVVM
ncbi:hypothetical protein ElyMa_002367700 [Elysia marginata]|uniref:Uncharacterized protein n=1 Tax=Elysia marginata TaxID=1093978 RepID=A0AAV4GDC5_9GAST|nr:hypothetical protein ElyMa_002367700 [Elysia marginata]